MGYLHLTTIDSLWKSATASLTMKKSSAALLSQTFKISLITLEIRVWDLEFIRTCLLITQFESNYIGVDLSR